MSIYAGLDVSDKTTHICVVDAEGLAQIARTGWFKCVHMKASATHKSVQYANNTGASQVLNVGSAALTALQGDTTAQKLAEVKAEADLIAQQQRLVGCLTDPATCK